MLFRVNSIKRSFYICWGMSKPKIFHGANFFIIKYRPRLLYMKIRPYMSILFIKYEIQALKMINIFLFTFFFSHKLYFQFIIVLIFTSWSFYSVKNGQKMQEFNECLEKRQNLSKFVKINQITSKNVYFRQLSSNFMLSKNIKFCQKTIN